MLLLLRLSWEIPWLLLLLTLAKQGLLCHPLTMVSNHCWIEPKLDLHLFWSSSSNSPVPGAVVALSFEPAAAVVVVALAVVRSIAAAVGERLQLFA